MIKRTLAYLLLAFLCFSCSDIQQSNEKDKTLTEQWDIEENISPEEQEILQERIDRIKALRKNGLPEEIQQTWEKILEDSKNYFGVDELPQTEIQEGVYSWFPAEYLEGEKHKELIKFLSPRVVELAKLYEKYGLKEYDLNVSEFNASTQGLGPPGGSNNHGSIASVFFQGGTTYTLASSWTSADETGVGLDGYVSGLASDSFFMIQPTGYYVEYFSGLTFPYQVNGCIFISADHTVNLINIGSSNDMDCTAR